MGLRAFVVMVTLGLALVSCQSTPTSVSLSMEGMWSYTLTDTNRNTWDAGTLTLAGDQEGQGEQRDTYGTVDVVTWSIQAGVFRLIGPQDWQGKAVSNRRIEGSWTASNGDHGTFVLTRL